VSRPGSEGRTLFAAPHAPEEWGGVVVPFADLANTDEVTIAHARFVAMGIAYHYASLNESQRQFLTCPPGQEVPHTFVAIGSGLLHATGLLRTVIDRRITVPRNEVSNMPPEPKDKQRQSQSKIMFGRTVDAMDSQMMYHGRTARRVEDGRRGSKVVHSRTVAYGGSLVAQNALAVVDSAHIARPAEQHLEVLPGDMVVGQAYDVERPGSNAEELVRISAVVLVGGGVPMPRQPS
jgi:hypothetical protein